MQSLKNLLRISNLIPLPLNTKPNVSDTSVYSLKPNLSTNILYANLEASHSVCCILSSDIKKKMSDAHKKVLVYTFSSRAGLMISTL